MILRINGLALMFGGLCAVMLAIWASSPHVRGRGAGAASATSGARPGTAQYPEGFTVLARDVAQELRLDGEHAYWLKCRTGKYDCSLMRVEHAGGDPVAVASGLKAPHSLLIGEAKILWLDTSGLMAIPKTGGQPERLAETGSYTRGLAARGDALIFATSDALVELSKGERVKLGELPGDGMEVIADSAAIYASVYRQRDGVWSIVRVPEMGVVKHLATGVEGPVKNLSQDAEHLFWSTDECVMRLAKSGEPAPATVGCFGKGPWSVRGFDVDGGDIFVATKNRLVKLPKEGGTAVDVLTFPVVVGSVYAEALQVGEIGVARSAFVLGAGGVLGRYAR